MVKPSISAELFIQNRSRLKSLLLPNSLALLNANDNPPTNADGTLIAVPNSDLFYLSGIDQEHSILLIYPDADDEKQREILFLRQPSEENQLWEGHKLTREEARAVSGVNTILWLEDFPKMFHRLMCECDHAYLNTNEHKRAVIEVETRDARFVQDCKSRYPLHDYQRLARVMHKLRVEKSPLEVDLIQKACDVTKQGFLRSLKIIKPGVSEAEVEAEFAHEFVRQRCRFAYPPIIATGLNACCLHYNTNDSICRKGDLLLMDVAAARANYNSDLTRTVPVNGGFTRRQKSVYNAVLRVLQQSIAGLVPGKLVKDWQKEAEQMIEKELVDLGLITTADIRNAPPDKPALKKYFMHGLGHPLGLDVHDVGLTTLPIQAGWVMTVEPGIYIPEEKMAVRLENDVLVTQDKPVDLMAGIPIEAAEIEELMRA
jgi:Xaa-Pro aminopeptidase